MSVTREMTKRVKMTERTRNWHRVCAEDGSISSNAKKTVSRYFTLLHSVIIVIYKLPSPNLSTSFDLLKIDDGQSEEIAVVVRWHRQTIVPFVELEEDLLGGGRQIEAVGLIPGGHRAIAPTRGVLLRRLVHLDDTIGLVDV